MQLFRVIRSAVMGSNLADAADYQAAQRFKETFTPQAGVDYRWVVEHAKATFEHLNRVRAVLDDKANDIIKYVGGGTGLFTLGALASITTRDAYLVAWALPAMGFAFLSVLLAAAARKPSAALGPPDISGATDYAHTYKTRAEAYFLGQWEPICTACRLANARKAAFVTWATRCYVGALGLLFLPVVVGFLNPPS
jgi:hypothetical protein